MATDKGNEKKSKNERPPLIRVRVQGEDLESGEFEFHDNFQIGREEGCGIQLTKPAISRQHAEITFRDGRWWLKDLDSANGIYMKGKKI